MAWETRKGKQYYYRSVRRNGRVVKEYVGSSPVAGAIAGLEALDRQRAEDERDRHRAHLARWDAVDQAVAGAIEEAKALADLTLTAAGYHRHDRGAWRKKRKAEPMKAVMVDAAKEELAVRAFTVPEDRAERAKIVSAALRAGAKSGDTAAALACIRAYPKDMSIGYANTTENVLSMIAGENAVLREILRGEAKDLKESLRGANSSPLERILVDRVVACGLQLSYLERDYDSRLAKGMSLPQSEACQKRIDRAHKRHLSAIKTLAQVRKLQLPQLPTVSVALPGSTQVNVAEKQVNIAQAGAEQVIMPQ